MFSTFVHHFLLFVCHTLTYLTASLYYNNSLLLRFG